MTLKRTPPTATDVEIGKRLVMARIAAGVSQEKLGELCGVTFQQIQKYEKATNRVAASRLKLIADALGQPLSYFFPDAPDPATSQEVPKLSKAAIEMGLAFDAIEDPKVRRALVALARSTTGETDVHHHS